MVVDSGRTANSWSVTAIWTPAVGLGDPDTLGAADTMPLGLGSDVWALARAADSANAHTAAVVTRASLVARMAPPSPLAQAHGGAVDPSRELAGREKGRKLAALHLR
jgi:hypothetical protein